MPAPHARGAQPGGREHPGGPACAHTPGCALPWHQARMLACRPGPRSPPLAGLAAYYQGTATDIDGKPVAQRDAEAAEALPSSPPPPGGAPPTCVTASPAACDAGQDGAHHGLGPVWFLLAWALATLSLQLWCAQLALLVRAHAWPAAVLADTRCAAPTAWPPARPLLFSTSSPAAHPQRPPPAADPLLAGALWSTNLPASTCPPGSCHGCHRWRCSCWCSGVVLGGGRATKEGALT